MTDGESESSRLARRVLFAFVLTFIAARALVFLIMSRRVPLVYLRIRGAHVHHLNYGIFLLTVVSGFLLFAKPRVFVWRRAAYVYGIALGPSWRSPATSSASSKVRGCASSRSLRVRDPVREIR